MRHWKRYASRMIVAGLVAGGGAAVVQSASASTVQNEGYDAFAVRRAQRGRYNTVGMIRGYTDRKKPRESAYLCSGSLIHQRWVLTAAHCVDQAQGMTFQLGDRAYSAQSWYTPKTWNKKFYKNNDIALVRLSSPIRDHRYAQYDHQRYSDRGKIVTSVGYGRYGTGATGGTGLDYQKRAVRNRLDIRDHANHHEYVYDFDARFSDPAFVRSLATRDFSRYHPKDFAVGKEGAIAQGDSGGPDITDGKIVGVHSWGIGAKTANGAALGTFGGLSYSTDVGHWAKWIERTIRQVNHHRKNPTYTRQGSFLNAIFGEGGLKVPKEKFLSEFVNLNKKDSSARFAAASALATIPEPATLSLLGFAGLGLLLRRSRPAA